MLYRGGQNVKPREGITDVQRSYLEEIRAAGPAGKVYNGRALRLLQELDARGLITLDLAVDARADGKHTMRLTAKAVEVHQHVIERQSATLDGTVEQVCACGASRTGTVRAPITGSWKEGR